MKNNRLFIIILIFSILIFLGQIFYLLFIKFPDLSIMASLFVPVIFVFVICIFQYFINNKWKILCYILAFIVILKQLLLFGLLFAYNYMSIHDDWYYKSYEHIEDYSNARNSIGCQKCIKHFPKTIPNNAQDIIFYKYSSPWWGSEGIFLKFKIDKKYIENEIKRKNIFSRIIDNKAEDFYFSPRGNIEFGNKKFLDILNYTFYIIFENTKTDGFPKEYGIGVNNKDNTILYYYHNPED